jgi:hypothetical protein
MLYLSCPRCGLTILPKLDWLALEHCPRCIARRRTRVAMLASAAPGAARAADHPVAGGAAGSPHLEGAA